MNSDPQKRPNAYNIWKALNYWNDTMKGSDLDVDLDTKNADNKDSESVNKNANNKNSNLDSEDANNINSESDNKDANIIKRQFLAANKMVKELQTTLPKHPDIMYTSKIINTQKISSVIKTALASKPIDSATISLDY
ncbi:hypothetical protein F8M41_016888 [Gigaspora margarita]|uniref:Uncharacterized protein n=1 Tax=Gigaspora margarita TaxID=4874 RepID=A0A8H4ANZ6_GIGMA|nr:hypothetical protein F8M41_016888 [Gigaspora margarita]